MANSYGIGNGVRVVVKFRSTNTNTAVDPTGVSVLIKDPNGAITTLVYGVDAALQKSATGVYFTVIDANLAGAWKYRWLGTGDNQAASENTFAVTPSTF